METRKKNRRSSSGSSRDSDRFRDDLELRRDEREDTRRKDDRTGRHKDRGAGRYAPRSGSKGSTRFEERFTDAQRQSRTDYSSDEGSASPKSKQGRRIRSDDRDERRSPPRGADSRIDAKSRRGKSRSRSRDPLDDDGSDRDDRRGRHKDGRQSRRDYRSYPSDDGQRDTNETRKSKHKNKSTSRESERDKDDPDTSHRGPSRPKSRNESAAESNRHEATAGELNRGFESSEPRPRRKRHDSDSSRRDLSASRNGLDHPAQYDPDVRRTDRRTGQPQKSERTKLNEDDFEEVELSPSSQKDGMRTDGTANRAFENSEVQLRPTNGTRQPRDQSKRNGVVHEPPEELTFRARELNNVPDPRSTLCRRTDMAFGVMDTRRDLDETDAFARENPKGPKIYTYIAAVISVVEAALGLAVGIFLLVDADQQKIEDYKTYMVITYMVMHGLAFISGLILIRANKECQLDLMVTWIAIQISTGIVFVAGTIMFLVVEMLREGADLKELVLGVPFIYFSSAFLIFIVLKVLTVAVVMLRYRRLTFRPPNRAPTPERPPSRWTVYQPPPDELRVAPKAPSDSSGAATLDRNARSAVSPPSGQSVRIVDESISDIGSGGRPLSGILPPLSRTDREGSERSQSSVSTAISEPPRVTIPRATTASQKSDLTSASANFSHERGQPEDDGSKKRVPERLVSAPKPDLARREFSYPTQELPHSHTDQRDWRQEVPYPGSERYNREPEDFYSNREPPSTKDRSPHLRPTTLLARPIPAERPSLSHRTRPENPYQNDLEPTRGEPGRRYLPCGAVPAIGSPEEWRRNHNQFSYGMPQPRGDAALQGAVRRRQGDYEPEPDY